MAKQHRLKIVAIEALYPMSYADIKIRDAGPQEFLGLIKNSTVTLTNSFHYVAFSVIFQRSFYLYPRSHMKVNSRMIDLLELLGLKDRNFFSSAKVLNLKEIEYEPVKQALIKYKEVSADYINRVLNYSRYRDGK